MICNSLFQPAERTLVMTTISLTRVPPRVGTWRNLWDVCLLNNHHSRTSKICSGGYSGRKHVRFRLGWRDKVESQLELCAMCECWYRARGGGGGGTHSLASCTYSVLTAWLVSKHQLFFSWTSKSFFF